MPLSVEELLRPRIKCMIRYPDSPFHVGAILEQDFEERNIYHYRDSQNRHLTLEEPQLYPEVFKEMQWWEDRKVDEMPAYTKLESHFVHKVERWLEPNYLGQPLYDYYNKVGLLTTFCAVNLIPATLSDYQAYINNQKTTPGT